MKKFVEQYMQEDFFPDEEENKNDGLVYNHLYLQKKDSGGYLKKFKNFFNF